MTKRIFFKGYDSAGRFPDGRTKLDVHFEDSEDNKYVWTPEWDATRSFVFEAYRIEKLNRPKGPEVQKFRQTAKKISSEEAIQSYQAISYGRLEKLEKGKIVIFEPLFDVDDFFGHVLHAKTKANKWTIHPSIESEQKMWEEAGSTLNWFKKHRGNYGKWIIVDEKLFDVEWKKKPNN